MNLMISRLERVTSPCSARFANTVFTAASFGVICGVFAFLMVRVIEASLAEPGCRAYSYAEDIAEPGLFRVHEEWDSRAALDAHFATAHMKRWQAERDKLGFNDRQINVYEIAAAAPL